MDENNLRLLQYCLCNFSPMKQELLEGVRDADLFAMVEAHPTLHPREAYFGPRHPWICLEQIFSRLTLYKAPVPMLDAFLDVNCLNGITLYAYWLCAYWVRAAGLRDDFDFRAGYELISLLSADRWLSDVGRQKVLNEGDLLDCGVVMRLAHEYLFRTYLLEPALGSGLDYAVDAWVSGVPFETAFYSPDLPRLPRS